MSSLSGIRRARDSRGTIIMGARSRGERRILERIPPAWPCATTFTYRDKTYQRATITNVTSRGAAFKVTGESSAIDFEANTVLELSIETPWEVVIRKGRVSWSNFLDGFAQFGVEYVELPPDAECVGLLNLDRVKIDPAVALRIPQTLALRRNVLPFALADGHVYVACLNALDSVALQAVEKMMAAPIRVEPAEPQSLKRALDRVYGDPSVANVSAPRSRFVDPRASGESQSEDVVALSDELLHAAILRQASDIHIDPDADGVEVRFRVDGALERYRRLPVNVNSGLISRYKVLCGMDIAEKRAAQDGAFKHRYGRSGQTLDVRVATLPTKHGERMTLRLLALQTESLTLERLGMSEHDLGIFQGAIDKPHGMILLTGPTGSGKTTTLYAAIRRLLSHEDLNVLTVEDPIEYEIKGVAQVEVDSADKVTFVKALRSVLRHDPDVVMIGEIRDAETADVAIKASLTGHLVFSTLHTNSAVSVITRLADLGVDRFLIAATLRLAVAQRLVRQLCPRCRTRRVLTAGEAAALGSRAQAGQEVFEPNGCIYCGGRGYVGRIGLFELLPLDEDWSRRVAHGDEEADFIVRMREQQIGTLLDDGVAKIQSGMTTVRDVLSAVSVW